MRLLRSDLVAGFGAAFTAGSFFSLLVILFRVPIAVFFSVSLSAPASFFLLAMRLSVPMAPVAFSFIVSFTLGFLTMVVLLESPLVLVVALLSELRVDRGAGGGTAVTLRAAAAAVVVAGSFGVTFLVDVLRTIAALAFGAVALDVAAFALLTIFDNIPDVPVFTGDVCNDFTGETGRASCDLGAGCPIFIGFVGDLEVVVEAMRSFVLFERGERT